MARAQGPPQDASAGSPACQELLGRIAAGMPDRPTPVAICGHVAGTPYTLVRNDTRHSRFLCPLTEQSGIARYRNSCPLI
ncbi:hypothetical protein [Nonomuraea gerenzanensis]|uniref:hypothetical protein n=2 Tax=Nonomuraea gerenzanensis TaxID=93944 RepID=UPI001CD930DB|nr:hypothetical protein [Nonomuraea gerenzanensis]UBU18249.1 hypothetical protein LCN96_25450 [Nonomuraea gerenzanensis]